MGFYLGAGCEWTKDLGVQDSGVKGMGASHRPEDATRQSFCIQKRPGLRPPKSRITGRKMFRLMFLVGDIKGSIHLIPGSKATRMALVHKIG